MAKRGLGRGLEALLPEIEVQDEDRIIEVSVDEITANPYQPRKTFDEKLIEELAASIKEYGVLQPIILRKIDLGYQLVAGERRLRAAKKIGLATIPAVIRDILDERLMEIALIENVQREDLNPVEEAKAYGVLMKEYHMTQEELSERLGKSRSQIANYIRLLQLDTFVLDLLGEGKISVGHGKVLAGIEDPNQQMLFARMVVDRQLSVRELEALVEPGNSKKQKGKPAEKNENKYSDLEDALKVRTGTMVKLRYNDGKGKIEIPFEDDDELMRVTDLLMGKDEEQDSIDGKPNVKKPFTV
jgi:ParB family chromosome partitioning protein